MVPMVGRTVQSKEQQQESLPGFRLPEAKENLNNECENERQKIEKNNPFKTYFNTTHGTTCGFYQSDG